MKELDEIRARLNETTSGVLICPNQSRTDMDRMERALRVLFNAIEEDYLDDERGHATAASVDAEAIMRGEED